MTIKNFNEILEKFTKLEDAVFFKEKSLMELKNELVAAIQEVTNQLRDTNELPKGKKGKEEITIDIPEPINEKTALLHKNIKSVKTDNSPEDLLVQLKNILVFVEKLQQYFQQEQIKMSLPKVMPEIVLHSQGVNTSDEVPLEVLAYILNFISNKQLLSLRRVNKKFRDSIDRSLKNPFLYKTTLSNEEIHLFLSIKEVSTQIISGEDRTNNLQEILQTTTKTQVKKINNEKRSNRSFAFWFGLLLLELIIIVAMSLLMYFAKNHHAAVSVAVSILCAALFCCGLETFILGVCKPSTSPLMPLQEALTYHSIKRFNEQKFSAFKNRYTIFSPKDVIKNKETRENKIQENTLERLENVQENKISF